MTRTRLMFGVPSLVVLAALPGCAGGGTEAVILLPGTHGDAFGGTVSTFAKMRGTFVEEVSVSIAMATIANSPAGGGHGTGPAGAVVALDFPAQVKAQTVFDHFEMHWEHAGHPPPGVFDRPHYDFHFYTVPVADVFAVEPGPAALPVPAADRFPHGYPPPADEAAYTGDVVPQMGYHATDPHVFGAGYNFENELIFGYYKGAMTFIEPMITRAYLMAHRSGEADVPVPAVFGRASRYPTKVRVRFDAVADAITITFSGFVDVH